MMNGIVSTAMPLDAGRLAKLTERFSKITGSPVSFTCVLDPSLLGGIVVELDGRLYDGSLKNQLNKMFKMMGNDGSLTTWKK